MAYKQKPKSVHFGTSSHRKALNLAEQARIKLARDMDNSSRPDGRSKSSAFQLLDEKDRTNVETVKGETTTTSDVEDLGGGVERKTDTSTTPSTTTTTTENEAVFNFKRDCYKNGVFLKGQTVKGMLCEKSKNPDYKEPEDTVDVKESSESTKKVSCSCTKPDGGKVNYTAPEGKCVENKPEACTKKKTPKNCECETYGKDGKLTGKKTRWLPGGPNGECGQKPPACSPPTPDYSRCMCWDPQGKEHAYDCDKKNCSACPKPKICEGKKLKCDMTSPELKAARQKCKEMGTVVSRTFKTRHTWSNSACKCIKTRSSGGEVVDDIGDAIKNCPKPRIKWKWFGKKKKAIGCHGVDGGSGPKGGGRTM